MAARLENSRLKKAKREERRKRRRAEEEQEARQEAMARIQGQLLAQLGQLLYCMKERVVGTSSSCMQL